MRGESAARAADFFSQHPIFQASQHIACYLPSDEEFDCIPLIEKIWQAEKNCYLPIITEENSLAFAHYRRNDVLSLNRYKILEPTHPDRFPAQDLDLVIVPLVAFDGQGNRLGMGAGFYDRTFSFRLNHSSKHPLLIGLGYQFQKVAEIKSDPWDVNLDGVLTEAEIVLF